MVVSIDTIMLMDQCRDRGIELRLEGGQIRWRAPSGAMTVDLLRQIKARTDQLKVALGRPGGRSGLGAICRAQSRARACSFFDGEAGRQC